MVARGSAWFRSKNIPRNWAILLKLLVRLRVASLGSHKVSLGSLNVSHAFGARVCPRGAQMGIEVRMVRLFGGRPRQSVRAGSIIHRKLLLLMLLQSAGLACHRQDVGLKNAQKSKLNEYSTTDGERKGDLRKDFKSQIKKTKR